MEVANAVSLPGALPAFQQTVTFRVHYPDGTVKEGLYTRISAGAKGHRDETTFGDYHVVVVREANRVSGNSHSLQEPSELRALRRHLPILLGRFDASDVIKSINEASVLGRAAKCIEFETLTNGVAVANEVCFDTERGVLLRWKVGDELDENTDFFRVGSLYEPGHIRVSEHGQLRMEIEQQMKLIEGPVDPKVFDPPSQWNTITGCANPRRPVAVFTPQPPPGNNGEQIVDVVVHAYLSAQGTVKWPVVDSSPNPALNAEALQLVSTWKFLPLMCNDEPAMTDATFVLHFQGR